MQSCCQCGLGKRRWDFTSLPCQAEKVGVQSRGQSMNGEILQVTWQTVAEFRSSGESLWINHHVAPQLSIIAILGRRSWGIGDRSWRSRWNWTWFSVGSWLVDLGTNGINFRIIFLVAHSDYFLSGTCCSARLAWRTELSCVVKNVLSTGFYNQDF